MMASEAEELGPLVNSLVKGMSGNRTGLVWVVRVGGDDGELPTMALHIRIQPPTLTIPTPHFVHEPVHTVQKPLHPVQPRVFIDFVWAVLFPVTSCGMSISASRRR